MSTSAGLFESFDNLDELPVEAIASWLKPSPQLTALENYLATKILYPQTLPTTSYQMQIDLAILREAIKANGPKTGDQKNNVLLGGNPFLNITLRKILIPANFLQFVPDLASLIWVFTDALLLSRRKEDWFEDLWTIVLTGEGDETVGSIILPQFNNNEGVMRITLQGRNYNIRYGSSLVIPCFKDRCEIAYKLQNGHVLGKEESALEVSGGRLGLVIDGRNR